MKKTFLLITVIFFVVNSFAQMSDVTLTVFGTGETEEKATQNALRKALEQAYGAFVVSRTSIVMDELESDEIVVNANGQIKDIKLNAISTLPNGEIVVSITTTVSLEKIINYAQGKGFEIAFMGDAFVANLKMMQLKVDNATKTLAVLTEQLEDLSEDLFSFNLSMASPTLIDLSHDPYYVFPCKLTVCSNQVSHHFFTLLENTLSALMLNESEMDFFRKSKLPINTLRLGWREEVAYVNLPINDDILSSYRERIQNLIFNSLYRVSIQEIGSNKEYDIWSQTKNKYSDFRRLHFFISERFKIYEFHLRRNISHTKDEIKLAKKKRQQLIWSKDSIAYVETPIIDLVFPLYIPQESMSSFHGFKLSGKQVFAPTNLLALSNPQFETIANEWLLNSPNYCCSSWYMTKKPFDIISLSEYNADYNNYIKIEDKKYWFKDKRNGKLVLNRYAFEESKYNRRTGEFERKFYPERLVDAIYLLHGASTETSLKMRINGADTQIIISGFRYHLEVENRSSEPTVISINSDFK